MICGENSPSTNPTVNVSHLPQEGRYKTKNITSNNKQILFEITTRNLDDDIRVPNYAYLEGQTKICFDMASLSSILPTTKRPSVANCSPRGPPHRSPSSISHQIWPNKAEALTPSEDSAIRRNRKENHRIKTMAQVSHKKNGLTFH